MGSGNAHANCHGHQSGCLFCSMRPKEARRKKVYRNSCQGSRNRKGKVSGIKKKAKKQEGKVSHDRV
jgi:hypothetical protein